RDQIGRMTLDQVQILVDGVRGAAELTGTVRRRQYRADVALPAPQLRPPAAFDMPDQRLGLILRQHEDRRDPRVDQIAQHEVDDAVPVDELQRGLRVLRGQRLEPRPFTAGQDARKTLLGYPVDADCCSYSSLGK